MRFCQAGLHQCIARFLIVLRLGEQRLFSVQPIRKSLPVCNLLAAHGIEAMGLVARLEQQRMVRQFGFRPARL